MYREERGIHTESRAASITTRRGAFESPFAKLSNAPSAVVNEPLMVQVEGDLVRIEGEDSMHIENASTHLLYLPLFVLCNLSSSKCRLDNVLILGCIQVEPGSKQRARGAEGMHGMT